MAGCVLLSKVKLVALAFVCTQECMSEWVETLTGLGLWRYHTSIFIPVYTYLEGGIFQGVRIYSSAV